MGTNTRLRTPFGCGPPVTRQGRLGDSVVPAKLRPSSNADPCHPMVTCATGPTVREDMSTRRETRSLMCLTASGRVHAEHAETIASAKRPPPAVKPYPPARVNSAENSWKLSAPMPALVATPAARPHAAAALLGTLTKGLCSQSATPIARVLVLALPQFVPAWLRLLRHDGVYFSKSRVADVEQWWWGPVGAAVGIHGGGPAAGVGEAVVATASQGQVGDVSSAAVFPRDQVVSLGARGGG